ncbi:autotransporter assembly complex protein TamA [Chitinimonas lacunae]|uniref:Translocation and assembly module subunit TamA n=1 Tax=Chitinimonas lacunae TaxID=1963018 RepID=A0ABV8MMA3_9NEIS
MLVKNYKLILLSCLFANSVWAAGIEYRVDVEAAEPIRKLLSENLDIVRWRDSGMVDREQLDRLHAAAPREIAELLATQGYFSPKIEAKLRPEGNGWQAIYQVEPGPLTEIGDVTLRLNGPIRDEPDYRPRLAEVIEVWPLPTGAIFTQQGWDNAKRRGLQALLIDRFPAARIANSRAQVDPAVQQAELEVEYDSGPRFTLGELRISGLSRYPAAIVERAARFRPGDPYTQQALLDLQRELRNLPYFSSVLVEAEIDPARPDRVPVRVDVTEAPRQAVSFGIGYGSDKGERGSLDYRHHNLFKRGWLGSVLIDVEKREQTAGAGIQWPPVGQEFRYSLNYKYTHSDVAELEESENRLTLQRARERNGITVEQSLTYVTDRSRFQEEDWLKRRALVLSQSWTRKRLDDEVDPRRGSVLSWQLSGALKGLLTDTNFMRAYSRAQLYFGVGERGRAIVRGEIGQVLADKTSDVPSDWLFRAGGAGSVRGYDYQRLGIEDGRGGVLPGRVMSTVSLEYQHPVVERWRAAVFVDRGGAADRWETFKAQTGVGVGVRWISPVGPLAFDVAQGRGSRNEAGERRTQWRWHFSLGATF